MKQRSLLETLYSVTIFFLRVSIKGRVMRYAAEKKSLKWKCLHKSFEIAEAEIHANH